MSKSMVYAVNSSAQSVSAGGIINCGSAVRRYGSNCRVSNGNAEIYGAGYYNIYVGTNISAATTGTLNVTLYKDGVAIPGAVASASVEADSIYAITISAAVRQMCNCGSTITVVLSGVAGTISNATVEVIKL